MSRWCLASFARHIFPLADVSAVWQSAIPQTITQGASRPINNCLQVPAGPKTSQSNHERKSMKKRKGIKNNNMKKYKKDKQM
ncbi:hypothetical protein BJY01DRAFT_230270 [Aspergillus pseudoustus]|uniref:Mitochondrial mRNA-processing protein COX24 C-terminal domain-containing protein n=1 Tax=Aspergillus pseudoustus TaxID=1810923 RepID=A0ABR4IBK0_9EURO